MASNINPQNINGNYPVAGQDNDSQGFRNNFTNIKNNLSAAAAEITDLQNKAVLKAPLTGQTLDNDFENALVSNIRLRGVRQVIRPLGPVSGSVLIDVDLAPVHTLTTDGSVTLAFDGWPVSSNSYAEVQVRVNVVNVAHTVTLPVEVVGTGIQGLVSDTLTLAAVGVYDLVFATANGGAAVQLISISPSATPFNASSQTLTDADSDTVSLATTATGFITTGGLSGNSTATLGDGVEGQIKTLIFYDKDTDDVVVTVTSAGWTGAGTITLDATAEACTLQWFNDAWFCVGNNGATLA
jgi:hypothetical protein